MNARMFFQVYDEWPGWYAVLWYGSGFWWCRGGSDCLERCSCWYGGSYCWIRRGFEWFARSFAPFVAVRSGNLSGCSRSALALEGKSLRISLLSWFLGEDTPLVVPVRGHLDSVKPFMKRDYYIGRGCRQRSLRCSPSANPFKVAKHGRERAIELFAKHLNDDFSLRSSVWMLAGLRLLCHCGPLQSCHADALVTAFTEDSQELTIATILQPACLPLQRN